jgi:glycosyltransferase involved in cell wall biosynthesis
MMADTSLIYDFTIPVLNEEKRLPVGMATLHRYLVDLGLERFTVTVADNGSTDATEGVAKRLMGTYPSMRYVKVGERGVGLALKTSWGQSTADVVGYLDVDLATNIKHLAEVVRLFEKERAVIVNGSRNLPASQVVNRSLLRTITSRVFNMLLRLTLGVNFTDGMCGFKFLRRSAYGQIVKAGVINDGWFFCTEILFVAEKLGLPIRELPVHWTDDRDSRVRLVSLTTYYIAEILKLRQRKIVPLPRSASQ